jgi:HEAT repeat protein
MASVEEERVATLVADLASGDGSTREAARLTLVGVGRAAVPPLVDALDDQRQQVRWEAAKALVEIADPASAPAFVLALEDRVFSVRWLAAEGLIGLGRAGLEPLLRALVDRPESFNLREGAHHVIHDLHHRGGSLAPVLEPVLAALEGTEPSLAAPWEAERALEALVGPGPAERRSVEGPAADTTTAEEPEGA